MMSTISNSIIIILSTLSITYGTPCVPSKIKNGQPFPQIFTSDIVYFTLKTEVNILAFGINTPAATTKTAAFYQEYYMNITGDRKGRVDRQSNKGTESIYYQQFTKSTQQITGTKCVVTPYSGSTLNQSAYVMWGFDDTFENGNAYMYGPSSVWVNAYNLLIADVHSGKPVYSGKTPVRGINANMFRACYNRDTTSLTVTYYVSADGRNTPLRVDILGTYFQGVNAYGSQTYNYISFEKNIQDVRVFQIPTGIGCDGMPKINDFKVPPPRFSFKAEVLHIPSTGRYSYSVQDPRIDYFTMFYDYPNKISTVFNRKGSKSEIHINDFSTGVTYAYHETGRFQTCNIISISDGMNDYGELKNETTGTLIPHILNPRDYFNIDSNYYFIGETWTRGIAVSIYETVKYNFVSKVLNKKFFKFVLTYYIAAKGWKEYSTHDGTTIESGFPVRMKMIGYDYHLNEVSNMTMNYFQYDIASYSVEISHYGLVESCFEGRNAVRHIKMLFPRQPKDLYVVKNIGGKFTQAIREKIASLNKVSILRIPRIEMDYDKFNVHANIYITDSLPPLSRFTSTGKKHVPRSAILVTGVKYKKDCALRCLMDKKCIVFYSLGFFNVECYTDTKLVPDIGTGHHTIGLFNQYIRNSFIINEDKNASVILKNLNYLVNQGSGFAVKVLNLNGMTPPNFVFPAVQEKEIKPKLIVAKIGVKFLLSLPSYDMTDAVVDISNTITDSLTACESFCRSHKNCVTASYCALGGICKLSTIYMDRVTTKNTKMDTGCNIYTKPYLTSFVESPGEVTLEPAEKAVAIATSPARCAKACIDENKFDCKSFQFCQKGLSCLLHTTSYLSPTNASQVTTKTKQRCSLYRRFLMNGFSVDGGQKLTGYSGTLIQTLTFDQCYAACNKEFALCNSYDYCVGTDFGKKGSFCIIRKASHAPTTPDHKFKKARLCFSFQRIKKLVKPVNNHTTHIPNKVTNLPHKGTDKHTQNAGAAKVTQKNMNGGWSGGATAGLCIGLLVTGVIVGGIVYFVVSTFQKRRAIEHTSGLTISFSKEHDMDD